MKKDLNAIAFALAALSLLSGAVEATTFEFADKYTKLDRLLNNPSVYSNAGFPGGGGAVDDWQVAGYGEGIALFTMSQSIATSFRSTDFKIGGPNGKGVPGTGFTLDMGNYDIYLPPINSAAQYVSEPFRIQAYYADNDFCPSGNYNLIRLSSSGEHRAAVMRMYGVRLDAVMDSGESTLDFKQGGWNSCDPSGDPTQPKSGHQFQIMNETTSIMQKIFFRSGFELRAYDIFVRGSGDYRRHYVSFNGADVYSDRNLNVYNGDLYVNNSAKVRLQGALTADRNGGHITVENRSTVFEAARAEINGWLTVRDGAVFKTTESFMLGGATGATPEMLVDGATLDVGEQELNTTVGSSLVFTNGAVVNAAKLYTSGGLGIYGGTRINFTTAAQNLTFYGSTIIAGADTRIDMPSGVLAASNAGIEITDGAEVDAKSLIFNGGRAHFVVRNGAKLSTSGSVTTEIDTNALNGNLKYLLVEGGEYTGGNIDIGCADGNAKVQLDGGSITLTGGEGIRLQHGGNSTAGCTSSLIVNDGKLRCGRIRPARKTAMSQTPKGDTRIEMNGGRIELTDNENGLLFFQNTTGGSYTRDGTQYLALNGGTLSASKIWKGDNTSGTIVFSANGGTFEACTTTSESSPAIRDIFSVAAFAEKGLTIDTHGYSTYVKFSPVNETGKAGLLRKAGSGTLFYSGINRVSKLEVIGGTFMMADAAAELSMVNLSITNGAVFSTRGASAGVTVASLYVNNGTISLDAGDVIHVDGTADVSHLKLEFDTVPTAATPFLEVVGTLSAAQQAAIKTTEFANEIGEDQHATFSFTTEGGVTKVSVALADDLPITDGVVWKGASGGIWSTASNWDGGVPTATKRALFTKTSAGKKVSVTGSAQAGALTFALDGYSLTGNYELSLVGEKGACDIVTSNGTTKIESPLRLESRTMVKQQPGSVLELNAVNGGAISKVGTGRLKLNKANGFDNELISSDGLLEVAHSGALARAGVKGELVLKGGTLAFSGSNLDISDRITVKGTNVNAFTAFKTDADTVLHEVDVQAGSFIKRGAGRLTIAIPEGEDYQLGVSGGTAKSYSQNLPGVVFPEDGTAPLEGTPTASGAAYYYFGFGVYEGELVLKGEGAGASAHIRTLGSAPSSVGSVSAGCTRDAVLTVDNVAFDAGSNGFLIGDQLATDGRGPTNATLNIVNGGSVSIRTTQIGYGTVNPNAHVYINATNSTLRFTGSAYLTRSYMTTNNWVAYSFRDSSLISEAATQTLGGGIRLDFDNSYFGGIDGGAVKLDSETYRPNGEMVFRNGSTLVLSAFREDTNNRDLYFVFDNAEWAFNANRGDAVYEGSPSGYTHYLLRGDGVIFRPSAGAVYEMNAQLEGDGAVTVDGPGTVAFGAYTAHYEGASMVRKNGTMDFSAAGEVMAGHVFGGEGSFVGLEMENPRIAASLDDDWQNTNGVPVFVNCKLDGYVTVRTGRDDSDPLAFKAGSVPTAVARISGSTAVDLSKWRLERSGAGKAGAVFSLVDGTVYLAPARSTGAAAVIR